MGELIHPFPGFALGLLLARPLRKSLWGLFFIGAIHGLLLLSTGLHGLTSLSETLTSIATALFASLPFRTPHRRSKVFFELRDTLQFFAVVVTVSWLPALEDFTEIFLRTGQTTSLLELFNGWLGTTISLLFIAPPMKFLVQRLDRTLPESSQHHKFATSPLIQGVWSVMAVFLVLLVFGPLLPPHQRSLPLGFLLIPIVIASALLFSTPRNAAHLLFIAAFSYWGHSQDYGPYGNEPESVQPLLFSSLFLTHTLTSWVLNLLERSRSELQSQQESQIDRRDEELRQSESFLNTLIENIPDMIFVKDAKTLKFIRFNRAGEKLLGRRRDELIGKSDFDFFPKEQAASFIKADQAVLESGHLVHLEEPISTREQGERWLDTKKLPILDHEGKPVFLLGISEDITDKRKSEQDRERLFREEAARLEAEKNLALRNEFMSIAAHELRTPVSALKLNAELCIRQLRGPEISQEQTTSVLRLIQMIHAETLRLHHLTENLLDVSRIQAQRFLISPQNDVDLSQLVQRTVRELEPLFIEAGCPLSAEISPNIRATLDADRIQQVLRNIAGNAAKFGRGLPVAIRLVTHGRAWELTVQDHGIGMTPQQLERVFHPFERAVSYREFPGMGMGLYISNEIIRAHYGTLSAQSAPGQGCTFTVTAPLSPALTAEAA